jgi:transcriptional regulator with XRE-family HTH domain
MSSFSSRLAEFIENQKLSVRKFEQIVGVSEGTFQKVIKNNTKTSNNNVQKIFLKYPELNAEWLQGNSAKMYRSEKKEPVENTDLLKKELAEKDKKIQELQDQIIKMLMEKK